MVVEEGEEVDQGVEHLVVVVVEDEDSKRVDQGYRQKRTNKLSSFDIIAVTYYADSYESKEMRSCCPHDLRWVIASEREAVHFSPLS